MVRVYTSLAGVEGARVQQGATRNAFELPSPFPLPWPQPCNQRPHLLVLPSYHCLIPPLCSDPTAPNTLQTYSIPFGNSPLSSLLPLVFAPTI